MANNTYLQLEPIKGESTDDKHIDWIEVQSFNHGLSLPQSDARGGGSRASARAVFSAFTVNKFVDKASVAIHLCCKQNKHIAKLVLETCRDSVEKICYLKYEMENVLVSSVQITGGDSERATESVTFVYDTISWMYIATNNDGTEEKMEFTN